MTSDFFSTLGAEAANTHIEKEAARHKREKQKIPPGNRPGPKDDGDSAPVAKTDAGKAFASGAKKRREAPQPEKKTTPAVEEKAAPEGDKYTTPTFSRVAPPVTMKAPSAPPTFSFPPSGGNGMSELGTAAAQGRDSTPELSMPMLPGRVPDLGPDMDPTKPLGLPPSLFPPLALDGGKEPTVTPTPEGAVPALDPPPRTPSSGGWLPNLDLGGGKFPPTAPAVADLSKGQVAGETPEVLERRKLESSQKLQQILGLMKSPPKLAPIPQPTEPAAAPVVEDESEPAPKPKTMDELSASDWAPKNKLTMVSPNYWNRRTMGEGRMSPDESGAAATALKAMLSARLNAKAL